MITPPHPNDSRPVPQMHQRSIHHDYHGRGIYLITLCTEGRKPLLGTLVGSSLDEAAIAPTALGHEVLRCWEQIPEVQRQLAAEKAAKTGLPCERDISLLEYQLMPDHFHGIIFVRKDMDIALGDIIRGFMVGCTKAFNGRDPREYALHPTTASSQPSSSPSSQPASLQPSSSPSSQPVSSQPASLQPASSHPVSLQPASSHPASLHPASLQPASSHPSPVGCRAYSRGTSPLRPLWEKGYHDRLLLHEGQLQNMIDYVRDNPRRLMLRRQHRELFIVQRHVRYARWSFSAIGQVQLLDAPLVAVHVRRHFTDEQRRNYMNSCILAARRGAVLISPFISEHEKRVRDEAFREGLFCIQLCAEPFSDYHKPAGELIEHCSSGHLLLLTLVSGNAQERRITRDECTSLNAVAESMARQSNENI